MVQKSGKISFFRFVSFFVTMHAFDRQTDGWTDTFSRR